MTAKDFGLLVAKIVVKTDNKLNDLDKIKVSDDEMINSDFEKAIMAMAFTEIKEEFNKLKKSKQKKEQ